jgi:hypothetical protein
VLILTLFVLMWRPASPPGERDEVRSVKLVLADVSANQSVEYLAELPPDQPATPSASGELTDLLPLAQPDAAPLAATESAVSNPANSPTLDAGAMTQPLGSRGLKSGDGALTPEELAEIAAERQRLASLQPRGEPATIRVFGSGGMTGRKFVFVLDRSKSMGSDGLGVLERAHAELESALSQLTTDHQFQVVAYHHETTLIDHRNLLSASPENLRKIAEFVGGLAAFGGTEHENGLIAALALKPDVIVLLTDGGLPELNGAQLAAIRRMAGKQTQIHCIQFGKGSAAASTFMSTLAAENRGTYKYVDVTEWK